jgi:hypothetical protein
MKRFLLIVSTVLAISGSAPNARAVWVNGPGGPRWYDPGVRPGWGGYGYRPTYGAGYAGATAAGYPQYGYYYGYPPAAYPPVQPTYPWPANYGQVPTTAPAVTPYSYAPQPYYPMTTRVVPRPPATAAGSRTEFAELQKRADRLLQELTVARRELDEAQAELATWRALAMTPAQIKGFQAQLARLEADNSFLTHRNSELETKISWFIGPEKEVKMPMSLSGHVVAVDPKYSFVVLNIGENHGVAKNGKLLINRDGKLIGKLRVTTVDSSSSIANILPDWKVADVREGDEVIHQ